ncbi:MAG: hypothetical protein ACXAC7_24320 [Candidatus Hodarchaeales archaeon]
MNQVDDLNDDNMTEIPKSYKIMGVVMTIIISIGFSIILYVLLESIIAIFYPWIFALPYCYYIITKKRERGIEKGYHNVKKFKDKKFDFEEERLI